MWDAERAVSALRARGELWEVSPGLVGLRGDALQLLRTIEGEIDLIAGAEDTEDWPAAADDTPHAMLQSLAPAADALVPAASYHCYARHAGTTLARRVAVSARGSHRPHGATRRRPSERQHASTTRELIVIGTTDQTRIFLQRSRAATIRLARSLRLDVRVAEPHAPVWKADVAERRRHGARGVGWHLLAPVARGREVAIATFTDHGEYFGQAFDITLVSGGYASTACVAFGLERWMVALLVARRRERPFAGSRVLSGLPSCGS